MFGCNWSRYCLFCFIIFWIFIPNVAIIIIFFFIFFSFRYLSKLMLIKTNWCMKTNENTSYLSLFSLLCLEDVCNWDSEMNNSITIFPTIKWINKNLYFNYQQLSVMITYNLRCTNVIKSFSIRIYWHNFLVDIIHLKVHKNHK